MDEALRRLSALIDPEQRIFDVRRAEIWQDLIRYLRWQNHPDPEDGAQETIFRAISKIDSDEAWREAAENPRRYFFGFAWCVAREGWRPARESSIESRLPFIESVAVQDGLEGRICIDELMSRIEPRERDLLLRYYTEDRIELSRTLGIPIGTLRVQVHRICRRLNEFASAAPPHHEVEDAPG